MTVDVAFPQSLSGTLRARIEARTARVAIVGLGYVGLPLAETFAWGDGFGPSPIDMGVPASSFDLFNRNLLAWLGVSRPG